MPDYEEIVESFEDLPTTYYPGLMIALVNKAYQKGVFQKGGASRSIQRLETQIFPENVQALSTIISALNNKELEGPWLHEGKDVFRALKMILPIQG